VNVEFCEKEGNDRASNALLFRKHSSGSMSRHTNINV